MWCACCRDKGLGTDPCVENKECSHCDTLSIDQIRQLATPAYRNKKVKKSSTPSLVDPALVSVLGKVEAVTPKDSTQKATPQKAATQKTTSPSKAKKLSKSSDFREDLKALEQKWSERLSHLEALFLSKSLEPPADRPTFHMVNMSSGHQPPAGTVSSDRPFLPPADQADQLVGIEQHAGLQKAVPSTSTSHLEPVPDTNQPADEQPLTVEEGEADLSDLEVNPGITFQISRPPLCRLTTPLLGHDPSRPGESPSSFLPMNICVRNWNV